MTHLESDPRWSAPSALAIEYEVADFLYGLVRLLKPMKCFESGCGEGYATRAIAEALQENGTGVLYSCDTDLGRVYDTREMVERLGLPVIVTNQTGESLAKTVPDADFVFLDSGTPESRIAEFDVFEATAKNTGNCTVVLHDASKDSRRTYDHIRKLPWDVMVFPTPRGVAIFRP